MRRLACDLSFCDALGSRNTFSASAIASFRRSSLSNPLSSPRPTEPDAEIHKSIKAAAALLASSVVASTVALAACCPWGLASQSAPTTPALMSIGTAIATFPDGSLGGTPNREVGEIRAAATCFCLSIRKSWRRPYVASFDGTSARPRRHFKRLSTGPNERNDDNILRLGESGFLHRDPPVPVEDRKSESRPQAKDGPVS